MRLSFRALGVASAMLALGGCQALDVKYVEATLDEALKQQVPSTTLRYRVPRPPIPVSRGNTGIIRDGSLFVVIVGPGLHDVLARYPDDVELGVRLVRKPTTHFVLEKVFADGDKVDLFEGREGFRFQYPNLVTNQNVPFAKFPTRPEGTLGDVIEGRVQLADVELREVPVDAALAGALGIEEGGRRYLIGPEDGAYVVDPSDAVTVMMLDYVAMESQQFTGGVRVDRVLDAETRRTTGVVGVVNVRWIHLGGAMYYRAGRAPAPDTPRRRA
jgi:hypothetical protein